MSDEERWRQSITADHHDDWDDYNKGPAQPVEESEPEPPESQTPEGTEESE